MIIEEKDAVLGKCTNVILMNLGAVSEGMCIQEALIPIGK